MTKLKQLTTWAITFSAIIFSGLLHAGAPAITTYLSNEAWSNMRIDVEKDGWWYNQHSVISLPASAKTQLPVVYPYFKGEYFKDFMRMKVYSTINYPYYLYDEVFLTAVFNEYGELSHILCTPTFNNVSCDTYFTDHDNANVIISIY